MELKEQIEEVIAQVRKDMELLEQLKYARKNGLRYNVTNHQGRNVNGVDFVTAIESAVDAKIEELERRLRLYLPERMLQPRPIVITLPEFDKAFLGSCCSEYDVFFYRIMRDDPRDRRITNFVDHETDERICGPLIVRFRGWETGCRVFDPNIPMIILSELPLCERRIAGYWHYLTFKTKAHEKAPAGCWVYGDGPIGGIFAAKYGPFEFRLP